MHGNGQHTSGGPGRSGRRPGLEYLEHCRQCGDSGIAVCGCSEFGIMLTQARYPLFRVYWFVTIFLLAYVVAWLYSSVRATRGAGPGTALTVGLLVGFAAGFPMNLSLVAWGLTGRYLPLWWMLDLWLGAIFASLVAGWLYKD